MSIASWKKEFYKTPASKVSKKKAVEHSLLKWTGLLKKNLKKHKLEIRDGDIYEDTSNREFTINGKTCALCHHFYGFEEYCVNCPLYKTLGAPCDDSNMPFMIWNYENDAKPMVKALKQAIKR